LIGITLSLAAAACNPSSASNVSQEVSASAAITKVTKIIFVGKEHACDCTRKSVDAGWAALQKVLGTPAKVPVERLQIDTQGEKVMFYRQQRPMMALPAIYFVDGKGVVLGLLQGEVSVAQIAAELGK
ncbi:MAG: hypothetical protein AAB426_04550, partial [Myxococcota bacterium]